MNHLKKYKFYYLLLIIFFLASFRGSEIGTEALTYKVPFVIAFFQGISIYIIISCMLISLIWNYKEKFIFQSYFIDSFCFFIFSVILILSGNNVLFKESSFRIIFSLITFLYFIKVVCRLQLKYIVLFVAVGTIGFSVGNFLCYLFLPETIWEGRLYGLSAHPNFTGMASTMSGIFSLFFVFYFTKWKVKLIYLLTLIISASVCVFSGSRNSFFSLVLALFIFMFLKCKSLGLKVILCLVFLLIITLLINANYTMSSLDYEGRGNSREETWKEMLDNALELSFFGTGKTGATSNSYLFALVASGIIGFLFFIRSVFGLLKRVMSIKTTKNIYYSLFIMLSISLFFSALFEGFLLDQIGIPIFIFWLILVIPFKEKRQLNK